MKKYENQIVVLKSDIHEKLFNKLKDAGLYFAMRHVDKCYSLTTDLESIKKVTNFYTFKMFMKSLHSCPICNTRTGHFIVKTRFINGESQRVLVCFDCMWERSADLEKIIKMSNKKKYDYILKNHRTEGVSISTKQIETILKNYGKRKLGNIKHKDYQII
jgi:hypothetical protein